MLEFFENTHTYKSKGKQYTSVSTVLSLYKQDFDSDFWSTYKALERLLGKEQFTELKRVRYYKSPAFIEWACNFVDIDKLAKVRKQILKEWKHEKDISIEKGHFYHREKEKQAYKNGFEFNPFTSKKSETMMKKPPKTGPKTSMVADLFQLQDGYYPELMIWNDEYEIAGTADKVFIKTIGKNRFIDIDDYKTNKVIKKTNSYQKMRAPLYKMDDCNYNHYRLQISLYAWMLEQFGFKIRYTAFTHFNEPYKFSYSHTRKHIENLLKHYKKNHHGSKATGK